MTPATRSSPIRAIRRPRRSCISSILRTAITPSPAMRPMTTPPPCRPASRSAQRGRGRLRQCDLRRTEQGSAAELFAAVNNSANWIDSNCTGHLFKDCRAAEHRSRCRQFDTRGQHYRALVTSGGAAVKIADSDIDISDLDGDAIFAAEIHIRGADFGDVLSVNGALPTGITASLRSLDRRPHPVRGGLA